jgi:hypothetical protein
VVPRWASARLSCRPIEERPPSLAEPSLEEPSLEQTRAFVDEHGFFRTRPLGTTRRDPLATFEVDAGPPWTTEEAQAETRRFLDVLADGRPIIEDHPDPLEYAQRNGLLLLIGPEEEKHLIRIARRMPRDMAIAWRDALRGGHASDAFGPLSEPERLDEARVEQELRTGRTKHRRNLLVLGVVVVIAVAAAGFFLLRDRGDDEETGAITFDAGEEPATGNLRDGPPPAVQPALVTRLEQPVAVLAGDGPTEARIVVNPPATDLPQAPGAVTATLFRYNGSGQVVLVGPTGWLTTACIEVSPISQGLRPFETAFHETVAGACPAAAMRAATVGCISDTTIMLDLRLPEGAVGIEEQAGATAIVSAVRVKLVGTSPAYETISVNGQITVPTGTDVTVPTFGGAVGDTVNFDVSAATGTPLVGTCVLS